MSVQVEEYRARRARLGFNDQRIPVVRVPVPPPNERAVSVTEALSQEVKQLRRRIISRENEIAVLEARLENVLGGNKGFAGKKIAGAVARKYGFRFSNLLSRRRESRLVRSRQHVMWALREWTFMSLPEIGRLLGGLDHTTILHGIRKHQARIDAGEMIP